MAADRRTRVSARARLAAGIANPAPSGSEEQRVSVLLRGRSGGLRPGDCAPDLEAKLDNPGTRGNHRPMIMSSNPVIRLRRRLWWPRLQPARPGVG
jgi:hypothetical protein